METLAILIFNEYSLTQTGLTYQGLGYHTGDGVTIPAWKVDEHLLCAELHNAAQRELEANEKLKRKRTHGK